MSAGNTPAGTPLAYKTVEGRALNLYVVKPADWKASDRRPAVVIFHGGGWKGGSPAIFNDQANYLASRGIVCLLPEYRLLTPDTTEPPEPCIQDAKSAMRWVWSHAGELGIDPDRIAAGGGSAGAHLAAFAGMMTGFDDPQDDRSISPKPAAMILFNPVIDNGPGGFGYERTGDRYREFSPYHNVTSSAPPCVIFLGSDDHYIPVRVVEEFQAALEGAGVRCDVFIYPGGKHGFFHRRESAEWYYETLKETDIFLASLGWLQGPPTLENPSLV